MVTNAQKTLNVLVRELVHLLAGVKESLAVQFQKFQMSFSKWLVRSTKLKTFWAQISVQMTLSAPEKEHAILPAGAKEIQAAERKTDINLKNLI